MQNEFNRLENSIKIFRYQKLNKLIKSAGILDVN